MDSERSLPCSQNVPSDLILNKLNSLHIFLLLFSSISFNVAFSSIRTSPTLSSLDVSQSNFFTNSYFITYVIHPVFLVLLYF
jgi:hypothetical protein